MDIFYAVALISHFIYLEKIKKCDILMKDVRKKIHASKLVLDF